MRRHFAVLCVTVSLVCAAVVSFAQSKPRPAFEVASVRVFRPASGFANAYRMTESRVDLIRPMSMLLMEAFRQQRTYRLAMPDWTNEVFVEIQATLAAGTTLQQVPEMLQTLLEDRFGLVTRRETRLMDGYELVVAEGGIKMREVEPIDELQKEPNPSATRPMSDTIRETPNGFVRTISLGGARYITITSRSMFERRVVPGGGNVFEATRMAIAELVPFLETNVDQPVVDRTGLTGLYQFTLQLPRDALVTRLLGTLGASTSARIEPAGGVSVFKELERLGLKLEKRRVPIEMIVVDKISRTPSAN